MSKTWDMVDRLADKILEFEQKVETDEDRAIYNGMLDTYTAMVKLALEEDKCMADIKYRSEAEKTKVKVSVWTSVGQIGAALLAGGASISGSLIYRACYCNGLEFEQTGSITSSIFKSIIGKKNI